MTILFELVAGTLGTGIGFWILGGAFVRFIGLFVPVEDKRPLTQGSPREASGWERNISLVVAGGGAAALIYFWGKIGTHLYRWPWEGGAALAAGAIVATAVLGSVFGRFIGKYEDAEFDVALRAERLEMLGSTMAVLAMLAVWWHAWGVLNQEWGAHDWSESLWNATVANFVAGPLYMWFDWFKGPSTVFTAIVVQNYIKEAFGDVRQNEKQAD
ncbi:hypothetical protein [uncultured Bradyrhizobium sp.]|jgi:hypothetical protein|uniref:hypothetical protein n=1 Tax=uncultured Bradyrhizobium sp. TaxID=199684 RepID=UPI0026378C02|nr:hypothetical protein [uncultured Bradyrhizobium sp.]